MKYIVSLENPVVLPGMQAKYNHRQVKRAYKAGAVVEVWHVARNGFGATNNNPPLFNSDEKYRAIVTPDMPQEIQDLVNHHECQYIDYPPPGLITKPVFAQAIGRGKRTPPRMKWADVIIAMANGEKVEYFDGEFYTSTTTPTWNPMSRPDLKWRIKPKTIMIGDTEVPAPETKAPERGQEYYFADTLEEERLYGSWTWKNDEHDQHLLRSGMIHKTAKAAQEHALALIKVSGGQHPEGYEVAK